MYAFLTGKIEEKQENIVVINCNGIGYEVYASTNTVSALPPVGEEAIIYTYLYVREDTFMLFGFKNREEKQMFLNLISVSGVGAKTAIIILSYMSVKDLVNAFAYGDPNALSKVKGIGKKTAERIVVDLKSKYSGLDAEVMPIMMGGENNSTSCGEAIDLLIQMGLTRMEASKLVQKVTKPNDTTEQIIAKALKELG